MSESDPEKLPNLEVSPSLGDVLQLQATIEVLPQVGLKDLTETERIAVNRYSGDYPYSEGTVISHIALSERVGGTDRYAAAMNYLVLRDGDDETTTRLIKRPPFVIGAGVDPTDPQAAELGRVSVAHEDYKAAQQLGMYDLTVGEVHELTQIIRKVYTSES